MNLVALALERILLIRRSTRNSVAGRLYLLSQLSYEIVAQRSIQDSFQILCTVICELGRKMPKFTNTKDSPQPSCTLILFGVTPMRCTLRHFGVTPIKVAHSSDTHKNITGRLKGTMTSGSTKKDEEYICEIVPVSF